MMGSRDIEEYFPRGGIKRKSANEIQSLEKPRKAKRARVKPVEKEIISYEESWQRALNLHGTLSYNKIQSGLVILGCVSEFNDVQMQIEYPGLIYGHVKINCISDHLTDNLAKLLKSKTDFLPIDILRTILTQGQLVPTKILQVEISEKGHKIHASMNPKDVNEGKTHSSFMKGELVWANIVSEQDHGYEMSVGVKNCRVFLPHANVENSKKYSIGEPIFCFVQKVESLDTATTLTVSAKKQILPIRENARLNLHNLLPGTKVEFTVEQVLPHGIKGKFMENCFGYIDETQIFGKVKLDKINEAEILSAYILYTEMVTKITYLTLRGLDCLLEPEYEVGENTSATIISTLPKGLYLQLGENATGFVGNKRLLATLPKNPNVDIFEAIKKKYPVGSRQSCRILSYSRMEELYICTFEQELIKEKLFSFKDLELGQNVRVKITKIIPSGLVVYAGRVRGFVPNSHVSNVKFSDNIKSKYTVGMMVNARVLVINDGASVIFTLKQGLVESDNCLKSIEEAIPGAEFVGFVVQTKETGALIAFYGDVNGWITSKELNRENSGVYADPRDYFYLGQTINVCIAAVKDNQIQLSLFPPAKTKKRLLQIGARCRGIITAIYEYGLEIELSKVKEVAILPTGHLHENSSLCEILLKTYNVGDKISNIVCVDNSDSLIVSRREFFAIKPNKFKIPSLKDLQVNTMLRCTFESESDEGVYVSALVRNLNEHIFIENKNLGSEGGIRPTFRKHQFILAKIMDVDVDCKTIVLSTNTDRLDDPVSEFSQIIQELERAIKFGRKNNWAITQYHIGDRVECVVEKVNPQGGCLVKLPNDATGVVPTNLCPDKVKANDTVEGVVLDYNFIDDHVDICLKKNVVREICNSQDGSIEKSMMKSSVAKILLFTEFYALGLLKDGQCNKQLIYLPLGFRHNDQSLKSEYETVKLKIVILTKASERIVGVSKKLLKQLGKKVEILKKSKVPKKNPLNTIRDCSDVEVNESDTETANIMDDTVSRKEIKEAEAVEVIMEIAEEDIKREVLSDEEVEAGPILSGPKSFFQLDDMALKEESSSDEEIQEEQVKKKKKLSPAERIEIIKREEERIRLIEKELADSMESPQSAEDFERLILAKPNSSELWLKYMALQIANTSVDKARAIGRRALDSINMTMIKEKFNVWIALLNLENLYGTSQSFEELFQEAVKYNDSLEVYLSVIKMLASSKKLIEMNEKIKKVRSKEKQSTKMWLEIGKIYYELEMYKEARNVKDAALKSILEKKRQFDLIVRFGVLEFQLGELDQAIANFETILDTFPAKVNIWLIYVDQLIKRKQIDSARSVLKRAVSQKFNIKTMKALFQKYIAFEEMHGSQENVEAVKEQVKEYVNNKL